MTMTSYGRKGVVPPSDRRPAAPDGAGDRRLLADDRRRRLRAQMSVVVPSSVDPKDPREPSERTRLPVIVRVDLSRRSVTRRCDGYEGQFASELGAAWPAAVSSA